MKVGDLVKCIWQPSVKEGHLGCDDEPMPHMIKGRFGFLVNQRSKNSWFIYFMDIHYVHMLSIDKFEVISESR